MTKTAAKPFSRRRRMGSSNNRRTNAGDFVDSISCWTHSCPSFSTSLIDGRESNIKENGNVGKGILLGALLLAPVEQEVGTPP